MISTYWNSLHEAFAGRTALVLLSLAIILSVSFVWMIDLPLAGSPKLAGSVMLREALHASVIRPITRELSGVAVLGMLVAMFTAVSLLVSTVESGWLELVLSKGTPRWQILLARVLASVSFYVVAFAIVMVPLAFELWRRSGVPTWQIVGALLLESLAFLALLSVAALACLPQKGSTLPMITTVVVWVATPGLAARKVTYYPYLPSGLAHRAVDAAYYVFPKCTQLDDAASLFIARGTIVSWQPIWSTAVFAIVVLVLTLWLLERKSF
jgi:hypothetical protein